jgi:hypothetical protein
LADTANPITTTPPMPAQAATLARWVAEVRRRHGRGYLGQIFDLIRYNRGRQRLNPLEYYQYRLYERDRFSEDERRAFIGHVGRRRIVRALNDLRTAILADDKLVTYGYLSGLGYPIAPLYAAFHRTRSHGTLPVLRDPGEVATFLRDRIPYPFFGKPLGRTNALGVASVRGYDAATDSLALPGDRSMTVTAFAETLTQFLPQGYLFVGHLWPHPAVRDVCGERLCTVRVYVLVESDGPSILAAVWKIATGSNMADNFILKGNLLAAVDLATGSLTRIIGGSGPDEVEYETHPESGGRLLGFRLPDWDAIQRMVKGVAGAFLRMPYQGWDVAITPEGPVLVEVNSASDFSLWQRAAGRGMMNERFLAILAKRR